MDALFGTMGAKVVVAPSVTGTVSVNFSGTSFDDALRAFIDGADQPISCSLKNGVYFVGPRTAMASKAAANHIGMIDLPTDVKFVNGLDGNEIVPTKLPFVYTTPDGGFRAESSHAINPFTNLPPAQGTTRLNLLMDGTVVIRVLAPGKTLSVSEGEQWTLSNGTKCGVLNLSPVRSTLFDWSHRTVTVSGDDVKLRDKAGRSVIVYPYQPAPLVPGTWPH